METSYYWQKERRDRWGSMTIAAAAVGGLLSHAGPVHVQALEATLGIDTSSEETCVSDRHDAARDVAERIGESDDDDAVAIGIVFPFGA